MKSIMTTIKLSVLAFLMPLISSAQSADKNYVLTHVPRVPLQPSQVISAATDKSQVQTSVQYFDGLGRPLQSIQQQGSPTGLDVVQAFAYDALGREAQKFLPYTQSGATTGAYHPSALAGEQTGFYNPAGNGIAFDNSPYAITNFEPSPLNRMVEQGAPGDAWQPVSGSTSGHTVKLLYMNNDASAITSGSGYWAKQFGVSIDASGNRTLIDQGAYPANSLYVTVTQNENWTSGKLNTTEEYKDYEGHVVLKRTFNYNNATQANEMLSTYYVYDDLGQLAFVLPPKAMADNGAPAVSTLAALCYRYVYDERKRLTQKALPGKDWEYMVYNSLDQPVLSQDGNQRLNNQWTVSKYDAIGRVITTGLWNSGQVYGLTTLQDSIYSNPQYDVWDLNGNTGYAISSYPAISTTLTANYYDGFTPTSQPATYTATGSAKVRGLLTSNITGVLNDPGTILLQVNYYDEEARPLKSFTQHYLGGLSNYSTNNYDALTNTYNFTGQPLTSIRQHYKNGSGLALTVNTGWVYDHMGRKLQTTEQINNDPQITLSQETYNEVGQLWQKKFHGGAGANSNTPANVVLGSANAYNNGSQTFTATNSITLNPGFSVTNGATGTFNIVSAPSFLQNITYAYNERGWLTQINDPTVAPTGTTYFAEKLNYNQPQYGAAAQYNGNIAEATYNASVSGQQHVTYAYDALNRLTDGVSTAGFSEKNINYDLNANIRSLTRDNQAYSTLAYAYENNDLSNRLSTVTGAGFVAHNYTYDANANSQNDGLGNIINYNLLNLPQTVPGKNITFIYDATGRKLRKLSGSIATEYISGIQYDNTSNPGGTPTLKFVQTEEGKANNNGTFTYEYTLKDHLGNNRVTFDQTNGKVGEDDYYPFGLNVHLQQNATNKYLYNNKELQDDWNNVYDYGARFYDPTIARWLTNDPLAEISRRWSSYAYTYDNPLKFTDSDGMLPKPYNPFKEEHSLEDIASAYATKAEQEPSTESYENENNITQNSIGQHWEAPNNQNDKEKKNKTDENKTKISIPYNEGGIRSTTQARDVYYNGNGSPQSIGTNVVIDLIKSKDFQLHNNHILSGKTIDHGDFNVNLTLTDFFVGRTNVNYSVKVEGKYAVVTFTMFVNDGFWDPNFVLEQTLGRLHLPEYKADAMGPNLETRGGHPYPFIPVTATETFLNPGYKQKQ